MKKTVVIITGGNVDYTLIKNIIKEDMIIIVADRGLIVADKLNIKPSVIVGDFDSVDNDILLKYKKGGKFYSDKTIFHKFKSEKDLTDTHIAINYAIDQNPEKVLIFGATGTRLDHTIANINILNLFLEKNIKAQIIDNNNKIYLINRYTVIRKDKLYGNYISLLPLTTNVLNVTLRGFKYNLTNRKLTIGDSIGISNEILQEEAYIQLSDGILIVIEAKD